MADPSCSPNKLIKNIYFHIPIYTWLPHCIVPLNIL